MEENTESIEISGPRICFKNRIPLGIRFLLWIQKDRDKMYRAHIFVVTYIAYASYYLSRKPISVVKNTLSTNCTVNSTCHAWAPFDGSDSKSLLGYLDLTFLAAYAVGMYLSGYIAEHTDIRLFLTGGMFLSGLFSILFGLGYFLSIHSLEFFIIIQLLAGFAQSSGRPAVVEAVGNWFGKRQRGLIMGIWNSHTSVGNIIGSAIAAFWSNDEWGWSFIVPGFLIIGSGLIIFFFLVIDPTYIDCSPPRHISRTVVSCSVNNEVSDYDSLLNQYSTVVNEVSSRGERKERLHGADSKAVSFLGAFLLPGVLEYSLCLFFAKLVSYTFLYWLPYYIAHTDIGGVRYDSHKAGDLSTFFDLGGIIGGIAAGVLLDKTRCCGIICVVMLIFASPSLFVYRFYSNSNLKTNIAFMIVSGIFVNGPCGLIITTISASLATQKALCSNIKAMATVTAIINGTGSLGAALGPLLTSFISSKSWNAVFYMLITANTLAALLLARQVVFEVKRYILKRPQPAECEDALKNEPE